MPNKDKPDPKPKDTTPAEDGMLLENLDDIVKDFMGEPLMVSRFPGDKPMPRSKRWALCSVLGNNVEPDQTKRMLQFGLGERIGRSDSDSYRLDAGDLPVLKDAIESADGTVNVLRGTLTRMLGG